MQPSVVYCKICGYWLRKNDFLTEPPYYPTDDERVFNALLQTAREKIRCPKCGNKKWIRKVYRKV